MSLTIRKFIYICLCVLFTPLAATVKYDVNFYGIASKETISVLKAASQLVTLEQYPPATMTGLQRRADADVPILKKALQSFGHYQPEIAIQIDDCGEAAQVNITICPGPVYPFRSFTIQCDPCSDSCCADVLDTIPLKNLGVFIGRPALPATILSAEKSLMAALSKRGFPLAYITSREVLADETEHVIDVVISVDMGPEALIGYTEIIGNTTVRDTFILGKIAWCEGDKYHPALIEKTQNALEASGLFSSVSITHAEEADEDGSLPLIIELSEARHRTLGFGAIINTQLGPGITADWEHRNVRGMGEKVTFRTDILELRQRGMLSYTKPDFLCPKQDFITIAEVEQERTEGFKERYFSLSAIIEKQLTDNLRFSYGVGFKELDSEDSNNNGLFTLFKLPLQVRYSNANNLLDPTKGHSVNFKIVPTYQVRDKQFFYTITNLTCSFYHALTEDKRYVFAHKLALGSIFGTSDITIPPPERLYAGTENLLRGYRYMTVSPLDDNNKPIGGRSLMVYSLELRARLNDKFGWVAFYEVGNVYSQVLPQFDYKQLQSAGFGLRYLTPVGPLRADIGVPLNRRRGIDRSVEVYFSIGQAF